MALTRGGHGRFQKPAPVISDKPIPAGSCLPTDKVNEVDQVILVTTGRYVTGIIRSTRLKP